MSSALGLSPGAGRVAVTRTVSAKNKAVELLGDKQRALSIMSIEGLKELLRHRLKMLGGADQAFVEWLQACVLPCLDLPGSPSFDDIITEFKLATSRRAIELVGYRDGAFLTALPTGPDGREEPWATQEQMAEIFGCTIPGISMHLSELELRASFQPLPRFKKIFKSW